MRSHRGSALIMALWTIAVLSIMILSFAVEAHLQTGINVYVRERNRVNRLIDAGKVLGEVVLLGYSEAKEWSEDEDEAEIFEDDRWFREKRALKEDSKCTIGPIRIDDEHPDSGTVTVEISMSNGGDRGGININELYKGGDQNYELRWRMILQNAGIDEDLEVEDPVEHKSVKLQNMLIASWTDWRDDDDTVTSIEGEECGAESKWYEERDDDEKVEEEDRRRPRNGSIPDIQELSYVRGFRDYPAVLTGGLLYPKEKESEDNPRINGIMGLFGVSGTTKVNVNDCTAEQLMTIPGIFNEQDDLDDQEDAMGLAQAIIDGLKIMPENRDDIDESRDWWPYKDWSDLTQRLEDNYTGDGEIGQDASQYLSFSVDENTVFKMKITGESMGMKHVVSCECYVNSKTKSVRYVLWEEDPKE